MGSQIGSHTAKWKVLGQQILMTKMMVPAELLMLLNQILAEIKKHGSAQPATMLDLQNTITQLVTIKKRYQLQDVGSDVIPKYPSHSFTTYLIFSFCS